MADVQKLVQTINGDKAKVQAIGNVLAQMDQAEHKKDTKAVKVLSAKADSLAQQLGPDCSRIMDDLDDVDPNSGEGKRFSPVRAHLQAVQINRPQPRTRALPPIRRWIDEIVSAGS
jgi:hypothetical protein